MKVALIGYGYWGKIIYNNLKQLDINPIVCDSQIIDDVPQCSQICN